MEISDFGQDLMDKLHLILLRGSMSVRGKINSIGLPYTGLIVEVF